MFSTKAELMHLEKERSKRRTSVCIASLEPIAFGQQIRELCSMSVSSTTSL